MESCLKNAWISFFIICFLLSSCARAPLKTPLDSMRLAKDTIKIQDSFDLANFLPQLKNHIEAMKISKFVTDPMVFGQIKIEKQKYIKALEEILAHSDNFIQWISSHFSAMEVYGRNQWGEVLTTGYFQPEIQGSLSPNEKFTQALYLLPVQEIDQGFSRAEIDCEDKLKNKGLELVWVDPIDAFFLQIQGSGFVILPDGKELHLGFSGKNGKPYQAIGKFLADQIPIEKMTAQKIIEHLKMLSPKELHEILNKNESYVYFKLLSGPAHTFAGMEVIPERTIATDAAFFPKGALAFLDIEEPVLGEHKPRLVFDQDTGGAIKGGGRIDLYFGRGDLALEKAGAMKRLGKLFYLIPNSVLEH